MLNQAPSLREKEKGWASQLVAKGKYLPLSKCCGKDHSLFTLLTEVRHWLPPKQLRCYFYGLHDNM
jgi:hypothetical protein